MLKILNFIFEGTEWNDLVFVLFSHKEEHKTTRHAKKNIKFHSVANKKEKGGDGWLRGEGSRGSVQK